MVMIYTPLEVADDQGRGTGRWHFVCYSDERSRPDYQRLTDKEYTSADEARNCPLVKAKMDAVFGYGESDA